MLTLIFSTTVFVIFVIVLVAVIEVGIKHDLMTYQDQLIYTRGKRSLTIPYQNITRMNVSGDFYMNGYLSQVTILYNNNGKESHLSIPLESKLVGPVNIGKQIGIHKQKIEEVLKNLPSEKIDPILGEFINRGEIEMIKIQKLIPESLYSSYKVIFT